MTPTDERQEAERENIRRRFESDAGEKWLINPVCHGETGFASWEYQLWLEDALTHAQKEIEGLKQERNYLADWIATRQSRCSWCGELFEVTTVEVMHAHLMICSKNPYVQEIADLKAKLGEAVKGMEKALGIKYNLDTGSIQVERTIKAILTSTLEKLK